jgi:hypothetical protein
VPCLKNNFEVEIQKLTFLNFYDIIEERKGVNFMACGIYKITNNITGEAYVG